jgi:DegV family protein with EDD domain
MATRQSGEWPGESSAQRALYRKVCIVTDSASDILPRHAQALGIVVVPNRVVMDGRTLRDGIDITASEFYARLPRTRAAPYTEPASAKDLYSTYQAVFNLGATAIISAHVSSRLSQLVTHAQAVRDYLAPAPIYVLDTQQAGIGMWPAVTSGARLANRGASAQEIYTRMAATLAQTRLYFLVESLEYLRRGGRVGRIQEFLGTLLDAHPILTIEQGEVRPVESVRPRARAALRMRELALARHDIETLLLCGTSIEAIAQMENLLSERYNGLIQKTWLGPTLGANTGPAVAIAVVVR